MKKILTDCDGVLLDWETPFHDWMKARGYDKMDAITYHMHELYPGMAKNDAKRLVKEFCNSAWIVGLPVLGDADFGVAELFNHGYRFNVITSLSLDPFAQKLRRINIDEMLGGDAFDELICLDTGADKDEALSKYAGTGYWWIEDKPENCDTGLKYGLKPILIDHPHNRWYDNPNVVRVKNWEEVCKVVLGEQSA
jgi:hypothetical protein